MSNPRWLYRDYAATQEVIAAYDKVSYLTEPAFVDSSKFRGGVLDLCNLRYLILSNRGVELGIVNANAKKFGLTVLPRGIVWRIFDKYTIGDKTQILLSPDETVKKYSPEPIIKAARRDFEDLYEAAPVASLNTDEWRNRLFFPVGLTDEGVPYPQSS